MFWPASVVDPRCSWVTSRFSSDIACLSSHHMFSPSPSLLYDDGAHAVLVAAGERIVAGDGLGPNIRRSLLRFLMWKVDSLSRSHSSFHILRRTIGWKIRSSETVLVLMLY